MANVLTDLAADIYKSADIVGRELHGFTNSVTINAGSERAALGGVVRSHFTRPATVVTPGPSMTIPEGTDQTVDNKTMTVDVPLAVQIPWTGEEIQYVNNGAGFETIYGDQILQAFRAIANDIEVRLWQTAYRAASRARGVAGTTPFSANFNELAQLRKIMADNGMPFDGNVSVVMDTTAGANLRSLAQLQKVNEAGDSTLLRQGALLDLHGYMLKESAGISQHVRGTANGAYQLSAAAGVGATTISVDTGTGTILAGDTVTFAGTTAHEYVVNTALAGGSFSIGSPGLRVDEADNDVVTVGAAYTPNVAFHRAAVELAMRPMAVPNGGDAAVDSLIVQDPWSGLVFEIRAYKGYKKAMFDISCVVGMKAWKPDFIAILKG